MLPNWRLTFDGLTKIDFVKRYFKSVTLLHSYRSIYSINSYASNFLMYEDELDGLGYVQGLPG